MGGAPAAAAAPCSPRAFGSSCQRLARSNGCVAAKPAAPYPPSDRNPLRPADYSAVADRSLARLSRVRGNVPVTTGTCFVNQIVIFGLQNPVPSSATNLRCPGFQPGEILNGIHDCGIQTLDSGDGDCGTLWRQRRTGVCRHGKP